MKNRLCHLQPPKQFDLGDYCNNINEIFNATEPITEDDILEDIQILVKNHFPKSPQNKILHEIHAERKYQDEKWGREHDDNHSAFDWLSIILEHLSAAFRLPFSLATDYKEKTRKELIQTAATIVAMIESQDRKEQENNERQ